MTTVPLFFDRRDTCIARKLRRRILAFRLSKRSASELGMPRKPLGGVELRCLDMFGLAIEGPTIVLCSPNLANGRHSAAFPEVDASKARLMCPVIARGDPTGSRTSCFPALLTQLMDAHDLFAVDLRPQGEGWRDGVAKIIARSTGAPLGGLRDREVERERHSGRLLATLTGCFIALLVAASTFYWQAVIAGQVMSDSLGAVTYFLHGSASDMVAFARVPGPVSARAIEALERYKTEADQLAVALNRNETYAGLSPFVRASARVYLGNALRFRGEYDAALVQLEQAAQIVAETPINATQLGFHSSLVARQSFLIMQSQTYAIGGDFQAFVGVSRQLAALARDELKEKPDDKPARAILAQAIADEALVPPCTHTTRAAAEARIAPARDAAIALRGDSSSVANFLASTAIDQSLQNAKSFDEIGLAILAGSDLALLDCAVKAGDAVWFRDQFQIADSSVTHLVAMAGARALPSRTRLDRTGLSFRWTSGRPSKEIENNLIRDVTTQRLAARATPDDILVVTGVSARLIDLGQYYVARRDDRYAPAFTEAVQIRRQLLADDPTNASIKFFLGNTLTTFADASARAGECATGRQARQEGVALLAAAAKAQTRSLYTAQALATGSEAKPCLTGSWILP